MHELMRGMRYGLSAKTRLRINRQSIIYKEVFNEAS